MHWFLSLALHSEAPLEVVLKLFFISWRMFLESGNQTLPRAALALHPPGVAPRWLLMVLLGTGGMLAMLLHSGCCQVSSHMVSLQSGPVCGLALPDGHSGADCKQPVLLNPGCCCRSIYSIYLELLSALQLLLIQINVFFLSLYFLQCWHVAVLQSVGAVLSLELRNNFSPNFLEILDLSLTASATTTVPLLCLSILAVWAVFLPLSPSSIFFPPSTSAASFSVFLFLIFVWKTLLLYVHIPYSKLYFSPIKTINPDSSIEAIQDLLGQKKKSIKNSF